MEHEEQDVKGRMETKVTEKSYVQVGFIVTVVGFIVGAVWWAATMDSKLNQVIEEIKTGRVMQTKVAENETHIKIIEMRLIQLETACKKGP